jgi:hypothetical protein
MKAGHDPGVAGPCACWLGREDSNLRMVESKSARILNDFNKFSDKTAGSAPRYINRLETQSE